MLPKYRCPSHPGEILKEEFLIPMNINQSLLAKHLGWKSGKINEIINGRRGISADTALALADVFDTSAEFWINLQSNYDLWKASQKHRNYPKLKIT